MGFDIISLAASSALQSVWNAARKNMVESRPTNEQIHNEVKAFTDRSEQATLVLAETSPNRQFLRFSHILRQSATQTVFIGLDTASEEQVCWHLLTLASFPQDVRQRVWEQLCLLESLRLPSAAHVLGLWEVSRRQQVVLITSFTPSTSIDEYLERTQATPRAVLAWLETILQLVETCKAAKLSPLHFSLENVRVTISGALLIEDLVRLPDPRDGRYLREFLHPSSSCDTAALGHFVLRLREVLPGESPCCDRLTAFAMTCFRHLHDDDVVAQMRKSLQSAPFHIKLIIDWEGHFEAIEFDFDPEIDSIRDVACEFISEFRLSASALPTLCLAFEQKLRANKSASWMQTKGRTEMDLLTLSPDMQPIDLPINLEKRERTAGGFPLNSQVNSIRKELLAETNEEITVFPTRN